MIKTQRFLNLTWVYTICLIIVAVNIYQAKHRVTPCGLCLLQRLCMLGIAIGPLLNLRFEVAPRHYALSILASTMGAFISLSQIALHACADPATSLRNVIFGFEVYTWSFIIFACSLLASALLLFIYTPSAERSFGSPEKVAFGLTFLVTLGNFFSVILAG